MVEHQQQDTADDRHCREHRPEENQRRELLRQKQVGAHILALVVVFDVIAEQPLEHGSVDKAQIEHNGAAQDQLHHQRELHRNVEDGGIEHHLLVLYHHDVEEGNQDIHAVEGERREHQVAHIGEVDDVDRVFGDAVVVGSERIPGEIARVGIDIDQHQTNREQRDLSEGGRDVLREHLLEHFLGRTGIHGFGVAGSAHKEQLLTDQTGKAERRFADDLEDILLKEHQHRQKRQQEERLDRDGERRPEDEPAGALFEQAVDRDDRREYHEDLVLTGIADGEIEIQRTGGQEHRPDALGLVAGDEHGDLLGENQHHDAEQHQKQLGIREHPRRIDDRPAVEALDQKEREVPDRPRQHREQLAAHVRVMDVPDVLRGVGVEVARMAVEEDVPHVDRPLRQALQIPGAGRQKDERARRDRQNPFRQEDLVRTVFFL